MAHSSWIQNLFASIDAKDTRRFLTFLTEDASFRYGNIPNVTGQEAVGAAVDQFFASIQSCAHRILRVWEHPDSVVCQGEVRYVRLDGRSVTVPFCNVFVMRGAKISEYDIYIDSTPLFAP